MKPPIASPHGEFLPNVPLTKCIEWNSERNCFVLRYRSSFSGRFRGELHLGMRSFRRSPWLLLTAPISLPIVTISLIFATIIQRLKRPCEFSVFAWGIEYSATEADYRTEWKNISEVFVHKDDFFVELRSSLGAAYCLPRENFVDATEIMCLYNIAESLKKQNGKNWEAVVQQFNADHSHVYTRMNS